LSESAAPMPFSQCIARRARTLLVLAGVALAGTLAAGGCSKQTVEERARETAEKIQKSMVDVEGIALEQKIDPAIVAEVQKNLTTINEYQGEINGTLDSVTINAIQSFQRTAGVKDDGIITQATRQKLAAAAAQAQS
jgi:peptidoglycan hydrolase-like protein with peptidoglycan-binding domain